jgi:hypothetical protein
MEAKLNDIVVLKYGTAIGWGRIIAFDGDDETIALVSWGTVGLQSHNRSSLQVVDITTEIAKDYIEYLYGVSD